MGSARRVLIREIQFEYITRTCSNERAGACAIECPLFVFVWTRQLPLLGHGGQIDLDECSIVSFDRGRNQRRLRKKRHVLGKIAFGERACFLFESIVDRQVWCLRRRWAIVVSRGDESAVGPTSCCCRVGEAWDGSPDAQLAPASALIVYYEADYEGR